MRIYREGNSKNCKLYKFNLYRVLFPNYVNEKLGKVNALSGQRVKRKEKNWANN